MCIDPTYQVPCANKQKKACCLKASTQQISGKLGRLGSLRPHLHDKNTQRIRIYPGKLKFILVKISSDSRSLHGKHAKENQTLFKSLTAENLSGLPCLHECKYGGYSDLSKYAVNLPG